MHYAKFAELNAPLIYFKILLLIMAKDTIVYILYGSSSKDALSTQQDTKILKID